MQRVPSILAALEKDANDERDQDRANENKSPFKKRIVFLSPTHNAVWRRL